MYVLLRHSPPQHRSDYQCFPSSPWYGSEFLYPSSPYGVQEMFGYNYSPYGSYFKSPPQVLSPHDELTPFLVKLLNNRIKKCRGCNQEVSRKVDGSPPDPPLNLVICHEERRPYRDTSNATRLSRPQNVYYHANLTCIRANHPSFIGCEVLIPTDVELSSAYSKDLHEHFGCKC